MRLILLLLPILLSVSAKAEITLPTVTPALFSIGRAWIWDYYDQTGTIYSTERYQVLDVSRSTVLIEMSSDYGGGQNLKPSTRLLVDVAKCLSAYRNPSLKLAWSIEMSYLSAGVWTEMNQPNTLAFEEKFNCNPHDYSKPTAPYLTVYNVIDGQRVFQQKLRRKVVGSWFSQSGPLAAVAVRKEFNADPAMAYWFRLRR